MIDLGEISWLHWTAFLGAIFFFLGLDLGVFHRRSRVVRFREAIGWTAFWVLLALLFALIVLPNERGAGWISGPRSEFITGYVLELSLSLDNIFIIALTFRFFQVHPQFQHRILYWGILGALAMRGAMIGLGGVLISRIHAVIYILGGILICTGIKMLLSRNEDPQPEKNLIVRLARRWLPISREFAGQHFTTRVEGRWMLTPLALVLLIVEFTDLVFAIDSIPAVFGVTQDTFVVFTSNIFAILGLRSLYFLLAGLIGYFHFLKFGLAVVLVYIGGKMVAGIWEVHIPSNTSLGIVLGIILLSILWSLARRSTAGNFAAKPPGDLHE